MLSNSALRAFFLFFRLFGSFEIMWSECNQRHLVVVVVVVVVASFWAWERCDSSSSVAALLLRVILLQAFLLSTARVPVIRLSLQMSRK
jgi:hypothetical protein